MLWRRCYEKVCYGGDVMRRCVLEVGGVLCEVL